MAFGIPFKIAAWVVGGLVASLGVAVMTLGSDISGMGQKEYGKGLVMTGALLTVGGGVVALAGFAAMGMQVKYFFLIVSVILALGQMLTGKAG